MRVQGNIIFFKSLPELYAIEYKGDKSNTVRRISEEEAKTINNKMDRIDDFIEMIQITNSECPSQYFIRRLIDVRDITDVLGIRFLNDDRLFDFSWKE